MEKVDVVIIGGGISGLMAAHRLSEKNPKLKIILLEKGHDITRRLCPIIEGKVPSCINCPTCGVMEGLAGAGAFSDGKYIISTDLITADIEGIEHINIVDWLLKQE